MVIEDGFQTKMNQSLKQVKCAQLWSSQRESSRLNVRLTQLSGCADVTGNHACQLFQAQSLLGDDWVCPWESLLHSLG